MTPRRFTATTCIVAALALASCVGCLAVPASLPYGWEVTNNHVPASHKVSVVLAVRHRNVYRLEELFYAVSDPDSPKYGAFLSHKELGELLAPLPAHVEAAAHFLRTSLGAAKVDVSPYRDFVNATVTVADVQRAYPGVTFRAYRHVRSGTVSVRASSRVALPEAVATAVDLMTGVDDLPKIPDHLRSVDRHDSRVVAAAQAARHAALAAEGEGANPLLVQFGESGNHQVSIIAGLDCGTDSCVSSLQGNLTVTATPVSGSGKSYSVEYPLAVPSCMNQGTNQQFSCYLTVTGVPNYEIFNVSLSGTFNNQKYTTYFSVPLAARPWTIPQTVHSLYDVPASLLSAPKKGQDGVILWGGEYADLDDVHTYLSSTGQPAGDARINAPNATSPNNPKFPGGEGQMDIELITSTATGVPSTFWYASNDLTQGFLDFCMEVSKIANPPLVWSCSWGTPETAFGPDGNAFISRASVELMKFGVRGMTMVFASGDAGATAAGRGGQCGVLQPSFPASSPYVLSVSGTVLDSADGRPSPVSPVDDASLPYCSMTMFGIPIGCNSPDATVGVQEIPAACCSDGTVWTGAGGFSNNFTRPEWQEEAVAQYLKTAAGSLPPAGAFNSSNRAYPDVAALSDQVLIFRAGTYHISGGTSAASPYTAGLMALLNSVRLTAGRPPLGPVAPLLYKLARTNPEAFHDITVGSNNNGELVRCPKSSGYTAAAGYDPVTGLGSLNIDKLMQLI